MCITHITYVLYIYIYYHIIVQYIYIYIYIYMCVYIYIYICCFMPGVCYSNVHVYTIRIYVVGRGMDGMAVATPRDIIGATCLTDMYISLSLYIYICMCIIHTYIYMHTCMCIIYIYIYICLCVCLRATVYNQRIRNPKPQTEPQMANLLYYIVR